MLCLGCKPVTANGALPNHLTHGPPLLTIFVNWPKESVHASAATIALKSSAPHANG